MGARALRPHLSPALTLLVLLLFLGGLGRLLLLGGRGLQQAGRELLQHLQVSSTIPVGRPDTADLHGLEDAEPLPLGQKLVPLLGLQFLANLVVLRVGTLLAG